jgi:putative ATPase
MCNATDSTFMQISAVSAGVKEVRQVIDTARKQRAVDPENQTVLFIDEIHRFNKAQQDALLQAVEEGVVTLLGATTENPSFEVIPPLRSRSRTFVLRSLTTDDLESILDRVLKTDPVLKDLEITFEDVNLLLAYAAGDARTLLNGLEMCCILSHDENSVHITRELLEEAFQRSFAMYDKAGEEHYNLISAFIKSVRGSDPDAALYWMARMLEGGEDPLFIARRLIVLASEDIGNADPNAMLLASACFQSVHAVGMPEARIILAQATTYLASTEKSNESYMAIERAAADVHTNQPHPVPLHLRNAPTSLMKSLNYGKGYKYAHDFPNHFVDQQYLPSELKDKQYYHPSSEGREIRLRQRLGTLWKNRSY